MKIECLNNNILKELLQEYYEGKLTSKELLKKYNIDEKTNLIRRAKLFSDEACEVCGGLVQYVLEGRKYCKSIEELQLICLECGHDFTSDCKCEKCVEFRLVEQNKKIQEKKKFLKKRLQTEPKSLKELTIKELLFIGIIKGYENSYNIGSLFNKDYFREMHFYIEHISNFLEDLLRSKIISFNIDDSDLEDFIIDEDGRVSYYVCKLFYNLNIVENIFEINIKDEIISRFTLEEIENFWKELCVEECLAYLDIRTDALKLGLIENSIRNDIAKLLGEILINYSPSEVISIIYRSVNFASNLKVEYEVNNIKVHKAVCTNINNHINKEYRVKSYNRPYELGQTILSSYFCENILEISSDKAFKLTISELGIEKLYNED